MRRLTPSCSCLQRPPAFGWVCGTTHDHEFEHAAAVFAASVVSNEVVVSPQGGQYRRVQLRVIESFKNDGRQLHEVMLSPSSNCSTVLKPNVTYIILGFRYSTGELAADMYSSARPLYWDGECPSDTRERRSVDEEVAVLLSYLRGKTNK
jgi:hypothetical protein